jgi:hypothetical protein
MEHSWLGEIFSQVIGSALLRKSHLEVSRNLVFLSTYSEDDFYQRLNLVNNRKCGSK